MIAPGPAPGSACGGRRDGQAALDEPELLQAGQVRGEVRLADERQIGDLIERVGAGADRL